MNGFDVFRRYRLAGDEDAGVGIECRDHFDGGRPIAYYGDTGAWRDDAAVRQVNTIPGLLTAAMLHELGVHAEDEAL